MRRFEARFNFSCTVIGNRPQSLTGHIVNILLISIGFIIIGKVNGNHERVIIDKIVKAPISSSFKVLNVDYNEAEIILKNNNITIGDSKTIEEICIRNQKSPNEIIELIVK